MKKYLKAAALFVGALALAAAAPVHAGFYYGGSIGQGSADVGLGDFDDGGSLSGSVDDSDMGWRVYTGFKVMRYFSVEASWVDIGEVSADATSDGTGLLYSPGAVTSSSSVDGYSVAAVGSYPVGNNFHVFAKFGTLFWDATTTLANAGLPGGSLSAGDDGNDTVLGAGMFWNYPGPGSLRFEYEQATAGGLDVNTISTGLVFKF